MQSKVAITMTFDAQGEKVNAIMRKEDDCPDLEDLHGYLDSLSVALVDLGYIHPKELKEQGSMDETCKYHSSARGHSLGDCDEFNKEVQSLIDQGIIQWGKSKEFECCMAFNKQLTLAGLNARIEHLENQQDRLLHLVHRLIDLRINTSTSDLIYGVMDALALIGHANERSMLKRDLRDLKGKKVMWPPQSELLQE